MYSTSGRRSAPHGKQHGEHSEDMFLVDLEGKIDTLKNVSTDLHSELRNSRTRLEALRGGFDEAQGYVNERLSNMPQLMSNKKGTIAMSKMVLLTTAALSVLYVLFKIALKAKTA